MVRVLLSLVLASQTAAAAERIEIVWPTPNPAYSLNQPAEEYVQPTVSGLTESALFGCVRNSGSRFHEGIDLKPIARDARGEAIDPVYAVMDGVVLYVNTVPGGSSYGRYVVLEHPQARPPVITLYAHLSRIGGRIEPGSTVRAGQTLGIMGRSSAGTVIPRERAHVHFEIGLWISRDFQDWYEWKRFGSSNPHGVFNGMNLIGLDPIDFYNRFRAGEVTGFQEYLDGQPVAYTVRVKSDRIPDFVHRYPTLMTGAMPHTGPAGWEIGFTGYGLPKQLRALPAGDPGLDQRERIAVIGHDAAHVAPFACCGALRLQGNSATIGSHTERTLQLMFGFR